MQKMWNHWYYLSVQGGQDSLRDFVTRCSYSYKLREKSQLIGSPINLRASNPTLEVKKKTSNPPYTMKRTQGRISRHSILAYVLGLFPKINTTVIFSFFTPFFPSF